MPAEFDPNIRHRKSIRLRGYDYSQAGAYFVTIVTFQRAGLFGEIINGEMVLNETGKIIQKWWDDIPIHFPGVETGAFVIMLNHVHGIIIIHDRRGAVPVPLPPGNDEKGGNILNDKEQGGETRGGENLGGETPPLPTKKPALGQIVAYFKYKSTKEINALDGAGVVTKLWQRNYLVPRFLRDYERIIHNAREMDAIWRYIEANPANWAQDKDNPVNP